MHQPITTVLSGPAAGALGAALVAREAGFDRVLTCDGGGTSTDVAVVLDGEPTLTTEGTVGSYPSKIPMIDVVTVGAGGGSIAWVSPEGALKVGPRSAGADPGPALLRPRRHRADRHRRARACSAASRRTCSAARSRSTSRPRGPGCEALADRLGLDRSSRPRPGILEISAWNQANALRQVTVKRGLDVRDFTLATFGGSGLAAAVPADRHPRAGRRAGAARPGQLSAFGLLTVDVRNDYVRTAVSRHDDLDLDAVARVLDDLQAQAAAALDREGFARAEHRYLRSADLRYFGQAFEVRVPVPGRRGRRRAAPTTVADGFHDAHEQLYGYAFRDDPRQPVEWVNLRVTGVGPIDRPRARASSPPRDGRPRARAHRRTAGVLRRLGATRPSTGGPTSRRATWSTGPAVIEEFGSTVPCTPASPRPSTASATCWSTEEAMTVMTTRRPGAASRSSRARWPRSRRRSRPRSGAPRGRR